MSIKLHLAVKPAPFLQFTKLRLTNGNGDIVFDIVSLTCRSILILAALAKSFRENTKVHFGLYFSLFEWFHPLYLKDKENQYHTQEYVKVPSSKLSCGNCISIFQLKSVYFCKLLLNQQFFLFLKSSAQTVQCQTTSK